MRMSTRDERLKKEGWEKKSVADEPRLSELVELYRAIGLDVHLEPVLKEDEFEECQICFEGQPQGTYMVIYTRKKEGGKEGGLLDELI